LEKDRRLIVLLKDQSNNERKKHPTGRVIGGETLFLLNTEASVRVLHTRARCRIPKGWVKPWIETHAVVVFPCDLGKTLPEKIRPRGV